MRRNQSRAEVRYDALTPESIEYYMPTLLYSVIKKQTKNESDNCAVCLIDFEKDDECRETICGHYFHKACLDLWLKKHENCPYCRAGLGRKDFEEKKHIKKIDKEEYKQQSELNNDNNNNHNDHNDNNNNQQLEIINSVQPLQQLQEDQGLENLSSSEMNSLNKSASKVNRRSISQGYNDKGMENELQDFENMINLHSSTKRQSHQLEGGEQFKIEKSINQSFPEERKFNQSIDIQEQNIEDSFEAIVIGQNYSQKKILQNNRKSFAQIHPQSSLLESSRPKQNEEDLEEINAILLNK